MGHSSLSVVTLQEVSSALFFLSCESNWGTNSDDRPFENPQVLSVYIFFFFFLFFFNSLVLLFLVFFTQICDGMNGRESVQRCDEGRREEEAVEGI